MNKHMQKSGQKEYGKRFVFGLARKLATLSGLLCVLFCFLFMDVWAENVLDMIYSEEPYEVSAILEKQCEDGGYTYSGTSGDTDVTAMVLQYLAQVEQTEEVTAARDRAWEFIYAHRSEEKDFIGFGNQPTSETTAQVLIAMVREAENDLSLPDDRTTMMEETYEAIKALYSAEDGYAHTRGGKRNSMATDQCTQAVTEYELCVAAGFAGIDYDVDTKVDESEENTSVSVIGDVSTEEVNVPENAGKWGITGIVSAILSLLCVVFCVFMLLSKKDKKVIVKNCIFALLVTALLIVILNLTGIQSVKEYNGLFSKPVNEESVITVDVRIVNGMTNEVIANEPVQLKDGDSALKALLTIGNKYDLGVDYSGSAGPENDFKGTAYVKGMAGLYEKEHGEMSGWLYKVNDVYAEVGMGDYTLSDTDVIEMIYSDGSLNPFGMTGGGE